MEIKNNSVATRTLIMACALIVGIVVVVAAKGLMQTVA
jgi:hypothetical protein